MYKLKKKLQKLFVKFDNGKLLSKAGFKLCYCKVGIIQNYNFIE